MTDAAKTHSHSHGHPPSTGGNQGKRPPIKRVQNLAVVATDTFLNGSPGWYKVLIIAFLLLNPVILQAFGPFVTGWLVIGQFIFILAMALKCYPLPPGGLLALQVVFLGLTSSETLYHEALDNFQVILLLIFMVAGIYFMKDFLRLIITDLLLRVKNKVLLSLSFCFAGAFLSAFLDALTVTAVLIAVVTGFYEVYHRVASQRGQEDDDLNAAILEEHRQNLEEFRGFLRNLVMHGAVGTALGGVTTLVGEPQNLLIGQKMGWHFVEFVIQSWPVTMPTLAIGLTTCFAVEKLRLFGYGYVCPAEVRQVLADHAEEKKHEITTQLKWRYLVQAIAGVWIIVALGFHLAEVGLIGLSIIVFLTSMCGITDEHRIGQAFTETLPFTALLVVFFAIVAMIHDQHLFAPVVAWTLEFEGKMRELAFFGAAGILSAISDNVFVATVYISEAMQGAAQGKISQDELEKIAVSINTGTNIPSVATPNGQAAFLFLLTSALAPLIRLSYLEMVKLALPYTIMMTGTALAATYFLL